MARKLRINILIHCGLVHFRFHFGKPRAPLTFMIFGLSDVSMAPQTNDIHFWRHQTIPENSGTYILGKIRVLEVHVLELLEKHHI